MQASSIVLKKVPPLKLRLFFEKYAKDNRFDYLSPSAWYSQSFHKILSAKGAITLIGLKSNIARALIDAFPDIGIDERVFEAKWNSRNKQFDKVSRQNRKTFFESYARDNGFDYLSPDAWYSQPYSKILSSQGAREILYRYKYNVSRALTDVLFPATDLEKKPNWKWDNIENRRNFFKEYAAANGFDFRSAEAWYSHPRTKILAAPGASGVIHHHGGVINALVELFPENNFDKSKFISYQGRKPELERRKKRIRRARAIKPSRRWYRRRRNIHLFKKFKKMKSKHVNPVPHSARVLDTDVIHQGHLEQAIQELFFPENVTKNTRVQIKNPSSGQLFEIDVCVPKLKLGFEFQDNYHYTNTWYSHRPLDDMHQRDQTKVNAAKVEGMTIVQVPFWWNGQSESLIASIQFERPELLAEGDITFPITLNPTPDDMPLEEVPNVGALMLASFPINPNFANSVSNSNWWMGEKYDGTRCCWIPEKGELYTRSGRIIPLLNAIAENLPTICVDGELWFGRGMFSMMYSLVTCEVTENSLWPEIRMVVFDFPHNSFHQLSFEERYKILLSNIPHNHPVNIVAPRILCDTSSQLNSNMRKIVENGGEGVVLRRVGSRYEPGRTKNLLKLKTSNGDTEGLVVIVDSSFVSVKLPKGQIFKVPMQSVQDIFPPLQVGEVVTFSYDKFRREIPVNVEIVQRRNDLKWDDVVANYRSSHLQELEVQSTKFTHAPRNFWTQTNMREYLVNFSTKLNLDPLLPSTWNNIPFKLISQTKGGKRIIQKFGDMATGLLSLFPDIGLQKFDKFKKIPIKWYSTKDRREFFENYARANGFDFRSPDAWYLQTYSKVLSFKGAGVLKYHGNSISRALVNLFPEIGLDKSKFKKYNSDTKL